MKDSEIEYSSKKEAYSAEGRERETEQADMAKVDFFAMEDLRLKREFIKIERQRLEVEQETLEVQKELLRFLKLVKAPVHYDNDAARFE